MKNNISSNSSSDNIKSTKLGWKFVVIVGTLTTIFFTGLYSAMSYEPDYMIKKRQKIESQQEVSTTTSQNSDNIPEIKKAP